MDYNNKKMKVSSSIVYIAAIPEDVWYNHIFYYLIPSDLAQLQTVCRYFYELLQSNSTELNEMWQHQLHLFMETHVLSKQYSQYHHYMNTLENKHLKRLYRRNPDDEDLSVHYQKVFQDVIETLKASPVCLSNVHLNAELTREMLSHKWSYKAVDNCGIKCVFIGDKDSRTTEFLFTAISNEVPEDYGPTVFDNVCYSI
jgi:hypothetical protein